MLTFLLSTLGLTNQRVERIGAMHDHFRWSAVRLGTPSFKRLLVYCRLNRLTRRSPQGSKRSINAPGPATRCKLLLEVESIFAVKGSYFRQQRSNSDDRVAAPRSLRICRELRPSACTSLIRRDTHDGPTVNNHAFRSADSTLQRESDIVWGCLSKKRHEISANVNFRRFETILDGMPRSAKASKVAQRGHSWSTCDTILVPQFCSFRQYTLAQPIPTT